eukprot:gnl/TRDRNA2_/TRDRNA2_206701_c0_seq1.p1 gnl/TRDRNA2_/TRDRNA2_206701_c0~~gnl/TRDRNA2_/TRDRNA2_206701_c0_seq1.p1  ORF type:complete len:140 (+),score=11.48 gnl/TRDRNA2_/TRDRNA2_206701_c0_seq1:25-444(+)
MKVEGVDDAVNAGSHRQSHIMSYGQRRPCSRQERCYYLPLHLRVDVHQKMVWIGVVQEEGCEAAWRKYDHVSCISKASNCQNVHRCNSGRHGLPSDIHRSFSSMCDTIDWDLGATGFTSLIQLVACCPIGWLADWLSVQ